MDAMAKWGEEVPFPITICDKEGIIVAMNQQSIEQFAEDGGAELIGKSLLDCHPEPARIKLVKLLKDKTVNTYISSSGNRKSLIHEAPWFVNGEYQGFVEISIDVTDILSK